MPDILGIFAAIADLVRAAAGPIGAGVHAFWAAKETLLVRKFALWLSGSAVSVIAHKEAAQHVHMDGTLLSFLLGFGSIAFLSRALDVWQSINFGRIITALAYKYLGLKADSRPAPLNPPSRPTPLPKE